MTPATVANMRAAEDAGRRCFAFSPVTGEEASASAGDYFWLTDEDAALVDEVGEPMVLVVKAVQYVDPLSLETC